MNPKVTSLSEVTFRLQIQLPVMETQRLLTIQLLINRIFTAANQEESQTCQ